MTCRVAIFFSAFNPHPSISHFTLAFLLGGSLLTSVATAEPYPGSHYQMEVEARELAAQQTKESLRAAIAKFQEALSLLELTGDQRMKGGILNKIAKCHSSLGEQQQALAYFEQSLQIWTSIGD